MYYLFLHKKADLERFRALFDATLEKLEAGKTPVYSETRGAKTMLIETIPYQTLSGILLMIGTIFLDGIKMNDMMKVALVLVVNNFLGTVSNFIFVYVKHFLRIKLCQRMGIEPSERNIAVFESLEYQSV